MTLQKLLEEKGISMYHLSKISGVPKTTIIDICSGKSEISRCSARTIWQISKALNCTMEEIMLLDESVKYDEENGTMDIDLSGDEMGVLIGKRGQTLDSLQYLVSLVVNKDSEDFPLALHKNQDWQL